MNKEEAILILKQAGWIIDQPSEIVVDKAEEDCIYLSQEGNGEWIVTKSGSVAFFSTNESNG